jgi:3-oxoadipate enol-lactonase
MKATINGIAMNYEVAGDAAKPAVVLHHPLAANLSFWDELTAALVPDYRVIRFDARGHGLSEAPVGIYGFDVLARDVIALMDHAGVKRAAFVGLSMGGMVGQYLGLDHAQRFSCLALVSTSSRIPDEVQHMWADRVAVAREKGMGSQVEPAMQRWVAAKARETRPDLVARFATMIETTPLEGYAGWCGTIRTLNVTDRLKAITLPTLVVVGEEDPATPVAASQAIQANIPGSKLVIMPGVSHMLSSENPSGFHGHLLPFLAAHQGA